MAIIADWKPWANLLVAVDENTEVIEYAICWRRERGDDLISHWLASNQTVAQISGKCSSKIMDGIKYCRSRCALIFHFFYTCINTDERSLIL